jgi:hypothetical protein
MAPVHRRGHYRPGPRGLDAPLVCCVKTESDNKLGAQPETGKRCRTAALTRHLLENTVNAEFRDVFQADALHSVYSVC